ncbi:MAG: endolytic transglycosylase MltG [Oligoflexia bacterium]|nr:endolytic transglycosylase MltG [Oligoflexia bacterium]
MKKLFAVLFVIAGLALAFEIGSNIHFMLKPTSTDSTPKIILIEPGSFNQTVALLEREGLISDAKRFRIAVRIMGMSGRVKIGEYQVSADMSPFQILRIISSGKSILHAVKIPEGFNIDQIAEELAKKNLVSVEEFTAMARDPRMAKLLDVEGDTLEGYLYPETYSFTHFTGVRTIIQTMVGKFKEVWERELRFGAQKLGYSQKFVVTLASIVEKETGAAIERPVIASVFHNRLRIDMPLQSDPTVIYSKPPSERLNITRADLVSKNDYNTYTKKGLPKGPISNPGKDAMIAVIEPAHSKFLYFVSRNDGSHQFSETLKEHNMAVQKFQRNAKAREGKSWRDQAENPQLTNKK